MLRLCFKSDPFASPPALACLSWQLATVLIPLLHCCTYIGHTREHELTMNAFILVLRQVLHVHVQCQ